MKATVTQAWSTPSILHLKVVVESGNSGWAQILNLTFPMGDIVDLRPTLLQADPTPPEDDEPLPGLA